MIRELEKMCLQREFDKEKAEQIMKQIDVNQVFKGSRSSLDTTLLTRAAEEANYEMVKLLLSNGADPNLVYDDGTENVLWMLQYSEEDTQENEIRLNIVKLLLENGADPHLKVEDDDLHDWALAALQDDYGTQFEYRNRFIDLLEAYDFQRDF